MANRTLADRLEEHTDRTGECWLWTGYCLPNGYGRVWLDGRVEYAHRAAYGHEYTEENTYVCRRPNGGTSRRCRACNLARSGSTSAGL